METNVRNCTVDAHDVRRMYEGKRVNCSYSLKPRGPSESIVEGLSKLLMNTVLLQGKLGPSNMLSHKTIIFAHKQNQPKTRPGKLICLAPFIHSGKHW